MGCRLAPAALTTPGPTCILAAGCPGAGQCGTRPGGRQGPMGTQRQVSYPAPLLPEPLLAQKMPLKQPQPLYASLWGLCPPSACTVVPAWLTRPGLAWSSPAALPDPALALAALPPMTQSSGLGAGALPTYLLPALILEQPGHPGLAGPPEGGGGGGG